MRLFCSSSNAATNDNACSAIRRNGIIFSRSKKRFKANRRLHRFDNDNFFSSSSDSKASGFPLLLNAVFALTLVG